MTRSSLLGHGAVGGVIAGAIVALWFLVFDYFTTVPFTTPTVLGNAVFGGDVGHSSVGLTVAYSFLHFGAFAVLGASAAWVLDAFALRPGLTVGFLFGLIILSAFHYTGMLIGGITAEIVLPPLHVLGSNALAGMAFMAYLHRVRHLDAPIGPAALLQYPVIRNGLTTGAVGAVTVAAWFLLLDVLTGRPFFTPSALGSAVFFGVDHPWDVRLGVGVIGAYTVLHFGAFAAVGIAFELAATGIARAPSRWLFALMAFVVIEGMFIGVLGTMASWVLGAGALGWWTVLGANALAVGAMSWTVWTVSPELRHSVLDQPIKTAV